jgi:taurine dioxygenase
MTPALGAIVKGVDFSSPISEQQRDDLLQAVVKHQVLFFGNQDITPIQQRDLAKMFGDLHIHPIYPQDPEVREIVVLDTNDNNPPDADEWHTDVPFVEKPPMGSFLSAKVLPPFGGDTLFSNTVAAYDALSEPFKEFLGGLSAEHDIGNSFKPEKHSNAFTYGDDGLKKFKEATQGNQFIHPVIRTHPVSGRKGIYVNYSFTTRIVDLSEKESDLVLRYLTEHVTKPEFTVR